MHKAQLNCTTYALRIRRRVSAAKDVKLMTSQDVCTALDEWTEVKNGLETSKRSLELSSAVVDTSLLTCTC